ncbi:amidohydrolase family protein [Flammeovirga kamogawensis]|uniref:Amidohydrolase family protein n=1 Tax=Flammeovirga kamogawensis TaxID=373891 RepID=A0ABX8GRX4_9BACT|nr:amidohydrolase family protein [Flammeovirga kamogawensis]MBB6462758.1 imidazolonepropionase-like amidohydrolase [Flammeovirga kamogawensis]QWG06012.1 amidohydrolase family protein [Flammeovirga kamogawensis]TRX67843.1 amidohydrolase family protein [Flammeovirga kamogawensis]
MNKHNFIYGIIALLFGIGNTLLAQENFTINGVRDDRSNYYAFTNASVHISPTQTLQNATLVIKEGKIVSVLEGNSVPKGAAEINVKGKHIYASFIDANTHYGMPKVEKGNFWSWSEPEKIGPQNPKAYNANDAIKANTNAAELFKSESKAAKEMRSIGFGSALTYLPDGIARGTSALVTFGDGKANELMLSEKVGAHLAFDKGSSKQMYPVSTMGYVALLRQTYYDADWYKSIGHEKFTDVTLEAFNQSQNYTQFFATKDLFDLERAAKVAKEFQKQYIYVGNGDEYQDIATLKLINPTLILPVDFPQALNVNDPIDAMNATFSEMKHWELAPSNLSLLAKENIRFSITAFDLSSKANFLKNIRLAVKRGLSEEQVLAALTTIPASYTNSSDRLGTIEKGKIANFIITSAPLFTEKGDVLENWIRGKRYVAKAWNTNDFRGEYTLTVADSTYTLKVTGKDNTSAKWNVTVNDSLKLDTKAAITDGMLSLSFKSDTTKKATSIRLSGWANNEGNFSGEGKNADGSWLKWTAIKSASNKVEKKKEEVEVNPELGDIIFPFSAYGSKEIAQQETILIKNATIWTNEEQGIVKNTDVLIKDGKIAKVGNNLKGSKTTKVIDGTGKHLTNGIIDEHSHIALFSVNDVAVMSSMVRMEDVLNPNDVDIYRQLAGGVTSAQLLHGSANPVGGQSAVIKFRWGKTNPDDLIFKDAKPFIKFALGENVKRSSWPMSNRFPQTRMGVEAVYIDGFTRAKVYNDAQKIYNGKGPKPRKDLQLEALAQILNDERFISCHSYVQSEINMLMKVADSFDFRVNTFTHILEGYKVADKMKKHGVGASTFSDWWAYKFEVYEAIPQNAALMASQGITVAINSDDSEMGRRLNQEAAKSVKYADMSEEEAWKMVTLNPAKLLHVDHKVGSIKVGKDADLVLWSDNPLSIYAKPTYTLVDGTIYFSLEKDEQLKKEMQKERARLVAKMQAAEKAGEKVKDVAPKIEQHMHCDYLHLD